MSDILISIIAACTVLVVGLIFGFIWHRLTCVECRKATP